MSQQDDLIEIQAQKIHALECTVIRLERAVASGIRSNGELARQNHDLRSALNECEKELSHNQAARILAQERKSWDSIQAKIVEALGDYEGSWFDAVVSRLNGR